MANLQSLGVTGTRLSAKRALSKPTQGRAIRARCAGKDVSGEAINDDPPYSNPELVRLSQKPGVLSVLMVGPAWANVTPDRLFLEA